MIRRKALLIGINYYNSANELAGCESDVGNMTAFLVSRGYSTHPCDMVVLTQSRGPGPYYPTAHNILAAMDWLVSEPGCYCFLHYSGHGGQIENDDGDGDGRVEMVDTIVPVDFERAGQIGSGSLHRRLVSQLAPGCTLFVIFDCCHSGSTLELPFVYRTDEDGNVGLMDDLKEGVELMGEASHLLQGGFDAGEFGAAQHLWAGATDFFRGLKHQFDESGQGEGLGSDNYTSQWGYEGKSVFMFSGCKDEQTSADAFIAGRHVGAMSWAFLETMKHDYGWNMSFVQILQNTRHLLQQHYSQIPQLSCGYQFDLRRSMQI